LSSFWPSHGDASSNGTIDASKSEARKLEGANIQCKVVLIAGRDDDVPAAIRSTLKNMWG